MMMHVEGLYLDRYLEITAQTLQCAVSLHSLYMHHPTGDTTVDLHTEECVDQMQSCSADGRRDC